MPQSLLHRTSLPPTRHVKVSQRNNTSLLYSPYHNINKSNSDDDDDFSLYLGAGQGARTRKGRIHVPPSPQVNCNP